MNVMNLYTGGGVSLSPQHGEGRHLSDYVRLVADEGKGITDGTIVTICADVPESDRSHWCDCEAPACEFDEDASAECINALL